MIGGYSEKEPSTKLQYSFRLSKGKGSLKTFKDEVLEKEIMFNSYNEFKREVEKQYDILLPDRKLLKDGVPLPAGVN
jgi:hypothetical protein